MTGVCAVGVGNPSRNPGPGPGPTFRVVLVQLVDRLLPVLDALLQRVDEALQQGAVDSDRAGQSRQGGSPCDDCARPRRPLTW